VGKQYREENHVGGINRGSALQGEVQYHSVKAKTKKAQPTIAYFLAIWDTVRRKGTKDSKKKPEKILTK